MNEKKLFDLLAESHSGKTEPRTIPAVNVVERLRFMAEAVSRLHRAPQGPCLIYTDPYQARVWELTNNLSVGRHPDCDVTLDNPTLSRYHFRLTRQHNGAVYLECLSHTHAIELNGRAVKTALLCSGDQIQTVGLRFLFASPETEGPSDG